MFERTIICLANSFKPPSGRCVAGKEFEGARAGQWIRPVSTRAGREVSEEERRYENGRTAQLLDIIRVPLDHPAPMVHQTENYVLAEEHTWVKEGSATPEQVAAMLDAHDPAFWIDAQSTYHGMNDKVPPVVAAQIPCSLKLISVPALRLQVRSEDGFEGAPSRRRVRGRFELQGRHYLLSVTDPEIVQRYLGQPDGDHNIVDATLCVSLAEIWNGFAFRVIASVITPDRFQGAL
jgi:hypothetical protein